MRKEVIADLLAGQFGVAVTFRPTVTVHIERIMGTGASSALISEKATPYLASLGFRLETAPAGSGLACDLEVERGSMPPAFFAATWEGVRAVSSVAADFRNLAPVLIHQALQQAGTVVCEPVKTCQLEIPASALPAVAMTIARLAGLTTGTSPSAGALELTGSIPTRSVQLLLAQLPEQTSGEGVFTSEVSHYIPVAGTPPAHTRIGPDPLTGRNGSAPGPDNLRGT